MPFFQQDLAAELNALVADEDVVGAGDESAHLFLATATERAVLNGSGHDPP
jgi:hypothetical protein